jgi:hypothetical protein
MGWGSAANFKSEIVAQMLVEKLGPAKAAEVFPININPDDETGAENQQSHHRPVVRF